MERLLICQNSEGFLRWAGEPNRVGGDTWLTQHSLTYWISWSMYEPYSLPTNLKIDKIFEFPCVCAHACMDACVCTHAFVCRLDLNLQHVCLWSILDDASPDVRQVIERNLEAGVFGSTHVSSRWDPVSKSQIWEDDPVDIPPSLVGFSLPQGTENGRPSSVILSEEIGFKHLSVLW